MKTSILALAALALVACDNPDEVGTANSGNIKYQEFCIDGVVYLVRKSGQSGYMSVKFNAESKVVTCGNRNRTMELQ